MAIVGGRAAGPCSHSQSRPVPEVPWGRLADLPRRVGPGRAWVTRWTPERVPDVEAGHVTLPAPLLVPDALHAEGRGVDGVIAGVAALTRPGRAPDSRDAVVRQ